MNFVSYAALIKEWLVNLHLSQSTNHRQRINWNYLLVTLPPIILYAGVPRTRVSRANSFSQLGQKQGLVVKSSTIRSLKHLTNEPLPPFRYLNSLNLQLAQKTSTVLHGCFLFGFATLYPSPTGLIHTWLKSNHPSALHLAFCNEPH